MEEKQLKLFDVLYRDRTNGGYSDVVAREMDRAIKRRYLEKGGALNEVDNFNFSNHDDSYTCYEAIIKANSPREAIDIFFRLLKEFEGGGS